MEDNLRNVPGIKFSGTPSNIDNLYIEGYISDEEYRKFYMDRTRTYVPELKQQPDFSGKELHTKGDRMETVQRKNRMLHDINMATKILDL